MAGLGHRIGPFELQERVAGGWRTSLFRGVRPDTSRPPREAAVRMADDPEDTEAADLIQREYLALRAVNNDPRFPQVIGHYAGQAALAVTWIEGATLADVVQARNDRLLELSPATVADILVELAEALRRLHAVPHDGTPLLHGHLGCQRVILSTDGSLFVTGLGVRPRGRHPAYTAPEQAAGAFIDWRTDQWALGAIGIELLLGERLYDGTDAPVKAASDGDVGPWVERVGRQWPSLGRILRRTLAPAAGDRYQTSDELIQDLMAARRAVGGLSQRRGVARKAHAFRDKLSAQRPPATPIDPRPEPAAAQPAQPRPVSPPKHTPVIVVSEESDYSPAPPAPQPRTPDIQPTQPRRTPTPIAPPRPGVVSDMALSAMFATPSATPAPVSVSVEPELEADLEPTEPLHDPFDEVLEPTVMNRPPTPPGTTDHDLDDDKRRDPIALQPSEIAGMVLGILFAVLGLYYLFTRLWV